jgi:hypothetical protein
MRVSLNAACSIIAGVLMMVSAIHCFYKDRRVSYAPIINVVAGLVSLLTGIILVEYTLSWQSVKQQFKIKWFTGIDGTLSTIFSLTTSIYPAILIKIANRSMKSEKFRTDRILIANIALAAVAVLVSVIEEIIAQANNAYNADALSVSNWSIGSKRSAFILSTFSRMVTIVTSAYTITHILPTLLVPGVIIYGALSLILLILLQSCYVFIDMWRFLIRVGASRGNIFYVIFNWASYIGAISLCLYALITAIALNRHLQEYLSRRLFLRGFPQRQSSATITTPTLDGALSDADHNRSYRRGTLETDKNLRTKSQSISSVKRCQLNSQSIVGGESPDDVSLLDFSSSPTLHKKLSDRPNQDF